MHETRREISEIVREVAQAVRSDRSRDDFVAFLSDRILRAMAAEGVMIWERVRSSGSDLDAANEDASPEYGCVRRLGRITDLTIPTESLTTHHRLISAVAGEGQPVVVPATPGATNTDTPANPLDVPVAIVPIELEPSSLGSDYVIEVCLEPGCGVATQRGYLRFVAQMGDLAGEFLRADQLRHLRRCETLGRNVDAAIQTLHAADDRQRLEATIVDTAAELWGFDRVGLCLGPASKLVAVSHVDTIDQGSPSAKRIRASASEAIANTESTWFNDSLDPSQAADELVIRCVVRGTSSDAACLVCAQRADSEPIAKESRRELIRYIQHAELSLRNLSRLESIPGGRWLAALAPVLQTGAVQRWKTAAVTAAILVLIIAAAAFPMPLIVYSPASIRPATVQVLTAPRDSVVEQIHVSHGQQVARGDLLVTLADPSLEEQITTLVGRRAVLVQKRAHWTETLVDTASHQFERMEQVQGERSLAAEEIRSIDDQLNVLQRIKDSLVLRADRKGIADAWEIDQRLQSRPLRRGDPLLQVIAEDSRWIVDAHVPQSRIGHVQTANSDQDLSVRVSLDASPEESHHASLLKIGPAIRRGDDVSTATAVLLQLSDRASEQIADRHGRSHQSGAPAHVMFHCGKTPAVHLVFQDLIRSMRSTIALYLASHNEGEGP